MSAPYPLPPDEVRVYSHSPLFYWWPVWLTGFVLGAWAWLDGQATVRIPLETRAPAQTSVKGYAKGAERVEFEQEREAVVLPAGVTLPPNAIERGAPRNRNLGL